MLYLRTPWSKMAVVSLKHEMATCMAVCSLFLCIGGCMCSSKYQNNKSQPLQWGTETRFWIMLSCKVSQERWDFQGRALADPDQCTVCQMQGCRTRWGWGQVASMHPCAKAAAGTSGPLVATVLPWAEPQRARAVVFYSKELTTGGCFADTIVLQGQCQWAA